MTDYVKNVREFHELVGIPIANEPKLIGKRDFAKRMKLITEELCEYCNAVADNNIVEVADALADLLYVVFGTVVEHGLPMDLIFDMVHKSNMTKGDGKFDGSGKWIKPENYEPVDLRWIVDKRSLI